MSGVETPTNGHAPPGTGFPVTLREEARRLAREGGWLPTEITRLFARRGVDPVPSPSAVKWWLRGGADFDRQMEHQRRHRARASARKSGGRMLGKARTPEFRLQRMIGLRAAGVSCNAIAKVMTFDFPDHPITENQVRYAIRSDRPAGYRK